MKWIYLAIMADILGIDNVSWKTILFRTVMCIFLELINGYIDGLVWDCNNSIANALELLQSCTNP